VSNIFTVWGSGGQEGYTYQEVPCPYSPPSPPHQPPSHKHSSHCPSSPPLLHSPPPPPSVTTATMSRKQEVKLESRLEALQQQISRMESCLSANVGTIMQLLQRQMPTIPPSYSTLTSAPNTSSSPILSPTATSHPAL
ncbi:hypothetical protein INR49_002263, partial [Caranx melampygus]